MKEKKLTKQSLSSSAVHHKNSEDVTRQVCRSYDEAIPIYCEVTDKYRKTSVDRRKTYGEKWMDQKKTNKKQLDIN